MPVSETTVRSNRRYGRIRWEHFAIFLFQVSVLRGGGAENCRSTRTINSIDKVNNRGSKGAGKVIYS